MGREGGEKKKKEGGGGGETVRDQSQLDIRLGYWPKQNEGPNHSNFLVSA